MNVLERIKRHPKYKDLKVGDKLLVLTTSPTRKDYIIPGETVKIYRINHKCIAIHGSVCEECRNGGMSFLVETRSDKIVNTCYCTFADINGLEYEV
jgi:calcineurin-like phosphoesterase family protein